MITKEQEKRLMKLRKAREIKIQFYTGKRTKIPLTILEIIILGLIILSIIWLATKL